jgi:hypothetical protein
MPNTFDPIVNQWYYHLDKGQRFFIAAVDEELETVEIQHFDGDLEEMSFEEWWALDIELSVAPENWAGPMDIGESDDLGTERSDTSSRDWNEPGEDYRDPDEERLTREVVDEGDPYGEGFPGESSTD